MSLENCENLYATHYHQGDINTTPQICSFTSIFSYLVISKLNVESQARGISLPKDLIRFWQKPFCFQRSMKNPIILKNLVRSSKE